jgi:hypothetical protein
MSETAFLICWMIVGLVIVDLIFQYLDNVNDLIKKRWLRITIKSIGLVAWPFYLMLIGVGVAITFILESDIFKRFFE